MKKLVSILLTLVLLCAMIPAALAAEPVDPESVNVDLLEDVDANPAMVFAENCAWTLYRFGLFNGIGTYDDGTPNFALDHATNRYQAITMLVRLLGKEEEALNGNWSTPFKDVVDWAKPYVGYAYANGLTNGTSETTFSGNNNVTATQYITFVLRALGYVSDSEVSQGAPGPADFRWDAAWELSDAIGLTTYLYNKDYNTLFVTEDEDGNYDFSFKRGDVAIVSRFALGTELKGSNQTLLDKLINGDTEPETPEPTPSTPTVKITEEQAYNAMIALKSKYPEGTTWTNSNSYAWKGGIYSVGYGCAGFAFMLSDAAFGDLPARREAPSFDTIRVGDIIRVQGNYHSVIVLEKHSNYVVIAEGNYNSSVHWGRTLSASEVNNAEYILTRYPN